MYVHCGLVLLFLSCVRTTESVYGNELAGRASDFKRFALWPSMHNALRFRRALSLDETGAGQAGPNEGTDNVAAKLPADSVASKPPSASITPSVPSPPTQPAVETNVIKETNATSQPNQETITKGNTTETFTVTPLNSTTANATTTEKAKALDLNNPGVVKRGLIVFGGFALMAVAYFIFYRRKNINNDMGNSLGMNDANQFRYGVLQNEDMKDNLESTRIPLTMESEDEIDEDLEIFDLMQKKKSLSYVNLQQNDEDIVLSPREVDIEGDNLLLDIEDASSDTLINWTNNGNKSIL